MAPERLVAWLSTYTFNDRKGLLPAGLRLQYHSRSDEHSKRLGELIVDDLLDACEALRTQAARGHAVYGINVRHTWPNGKTKTLDLAFGTPAVSQEPKQAQRIRRVSGRGEGRLTRILIACEAKATMTEHVKSQPRIYSELNDAHTIVHQGSRDTIAAGITMLNIAASFVSPLRQRRESAVVVTPHRQPDVTARMVQHLRRLPLRDHIDQTGLDAYCTFVVNVDNQGHVSLHTDPPAPQPGDRDHYASFIERLARAYTDRYSSLDELPREGGLSIEEAMRKLASRHPSLFRRVGTMITTAGLDGAEELSALLAAIEVEAAQSLNDGEASGTAEPPALAHEG